MKNKLTLSKAHAGNLQDAWHYAMLIIDRGQSTFDGCREYPEGLIGQVRAYENLLSIIETMVADDETHELVDAGWNKWVRPATFQSMVEATRFLLAAINAKASELGIDARTGERLVLGKSV